jgi:hypothetical protein
MKTGSEISKRPVFLIYSINFALFILYNITDAKEYNFRHSRSAVSLTGTTNESPRNDE